MFNYSYECKNVVGPVPCDDILGWSCRTIPWIQIGLAEQKRIKNLAFCELNHSIKAANLVQFEKIISLMRHLNQIFLVW